MKNWYEKPYYSLDAYCKNTYGEKLYKIALDAGFTCPNRDGTLDTRGCIFCSAGGSGDFASAFSSNLHDSLLEGKKRLAAKHTGAHYIAYFQAYTNTYDTPEHLEKLYCLALDEDFIAGISIATRPDCLSPEILTLLSKLTKQYAPKFIWMELGLQTIHEDTARYMRRGYPLSCFEQAAADLADIQIPVIVHVILGLGSETKAQMLETIDYLNSRPIWGIKLQLLHVLENTDLATEYQEGNYTPLSMEDYLDIVISCLERLSPDIVIHRVTGDAPKALLLAPLWSANKRLVLNTLHKLLKERQTWQGRLYIPDN